MAGPGHWVGPERRRVGLVFQDYALFPHLTVAKNIAFGLVADHERRVAEMLDLVGLAGQGTRYPHELSGGQQQRVALARALAPAPALLLLDEPFSHLDELRKAQVRDDLAHIIRQSQTTAVLVTHDTRDALAMADQLAVLRAGRLAQYAAPHTVYHAPASGYAAKLFGKVNLVPAQVGAGVARSALGEWPWPARAGQSGPGQLCIRPEQLALGPPDGGDLVGRVVANRFLGAYHEVEVLVNGVVLTAQWPGAHPPTPGDTVGLALGGFSVVGD
jgi:iron(III) transport system ATP-binding protein